MEKTNEIDLIGLAKKVLAKKKQLLIFFVVGSVVGVIVALSTPKKFTASVMLAPEFSAGGQGMSGSLADLASNFGVELGGKGSMDAIYPELYPTIFGSTDFVMKLFDVPVQLKGDARVRTYKEHIKKDSKVAFWEIPKIWLINMIKPKATGKGGTTNPLVISREDYELCEAIRGNILCTVDKKTSVISISITDQDPLVAAIMADSLQSFLQAYITDYRTKKARTDVKYYQKLTNEAKAEYEKLRRAYGSYADANTDVILESYRSRQEDLENEMQLRYNTYTTLSNQLQAAKAKLQERTPAFTIVEKPTMPYRASGLPRRVVVIIFAMLGIACDAFWVLCGDKIKTFFKKK